MGCHIDLVLGIIPQHSYPPTHNDHRLLKSLYIHLVGIHFLLACVVRVLPTWLTMLAAPVLFGRWTVT